MIGTTLDRYQIESKLGEGGMGVVYKARDTHLDRAVAIKVLPPDKVLNADRRRRFTQEAKAASALNHPGIVTVHDIRSDAGTDFIVMEFVDGRTLDGLIPPTGLSVARALRYAVGIAAAMAKAHEAGIIHRDLKPSNVIVTSDDTIKILDFGLAKLLETAEDTSNTATMTSPASEPGLVVGTAAYMSPEQAEGRNLDGRSDIFSFGAMLYEMVTGQRPFRGETQISTITKILTEDPAAPSQIAAVVTPELDRTILRCLRKDPDRRFQTMGDLRVALEDLAIDSSSVSHTRPALPRTRLGSWRSLGIAAAVLAAIATAAYLARQDQATAELPHLRALPVTATPGAKQSPSLSPDGTQVVFTWTNPELKNTDLYVQHIGAGAPLRLTSDPGSDYSPKWSPDGRSIAFLRHDPRSGRRELRLVPPLGGAERLLAEIRLGQAVLRPMTVAWCPNSRCLVVTDSAGEKRPDALFVVSVESGDKRQLTTPPDTVLADSDPAISPDGRWLVFRREAAPFTGELYLVGLNGTAASGDPVALTTTQQYAYNPVWMPDSTEILFSSRNAIWRLRTASGHGPVRLPFVGEDGVMPVVSRPSGGGPIRMVYVRTFADLNIWRVNVPAAGQPAQAPPVVAIASTRRDDHPNVAPDGSIAFISDRTGESEVWRADPSGSNAAQLTFMSANPGFVRWSPDGSSIAFHSNPEGQGDVLVVPSQGGTPRNVTASPANDVFPSFSRDGQWIYFSSTRTKVPSIWKLPTNGGEAVPITPGPALLAIESTDGRDLFYVGNDAPFQAGPLMRVPLKGGPAVKVAEGALPAAFAVLEHGVYYIELSGAESRLRFLEFATGRSTVIAEQLGNVGWGLTASPDGRSVFYARIDSAVDDLMLVDDFR